MYGYNLGLGSGGNRLPRDIKSLITATNGTLRTLAGPSHAYSAAAGQVPDGLGGVQVNTIPPVHSGGYYGGPAYTNLFAGGPTGVEAEVLTVQKYCLQCVGGSVDAGAYGTATPTEPLVFTASAASQDFTPTGCTEWMLSAAGGYVFPIIPPGQSVVSTSGTTTGNGIQVPLTGSDAADRLIECFQGVPDGTELVTNGTFDTNTTGWLLAGGIGTSTSENGWLRVTNVGEATVYYSFTTQIGARYKLNITRGAVNIPGSPQLRVGNAPAATQLLSTGISVPGSYVYEFTATATTTYISLNNNNSTAGAWCEWDNISVQKLNPAVGTVGVLMKMGAASAGIPANLEANALTIRDSKFDLMVGDGAGIKRILGATDGTLSIFLNSSWDRDEYHMKFVEFNGTKFRVGNKRYSEAGVAIDANIVWSHATLAGGATFDGSFGPTTFLRWFLNSSIPNWMRVMMVSNQAGLGDTELLRRIMKYGKF